MFGSLLPVNIFQMGFLEIFVIAERASSFKGKIILLCFQNIETLDNGKPFLESVDDVKAAVGVFRYYAGWCDKIQGQTIPVGKVSMFLLVCLGEHLNNKLLFMFLITC